MPRLISPQKVTLLQYMFDAYYILALHYCHKKDLSYWNCKLTLNLIFWIVFVAKAVMVIVDTSLNQGGSRYEQLIVCA